jgi:TetR/AcrR family transcriptional repressor of nem operon
VAALGSEMPRQSEMLRDASAVRVQRLIASVRALLPGASLTAARMVASTLVGSLQLARTLGDNAEGRALLSTTRKSLLQQYDSPVEH